MELPGRLARRAPRRQPDLRRPRADGLLTDLRSAGIPPLARDDHVRGPAGAPLVVVYATFACHYCALANARLRDARARIAFRHFPVASKHPRARPAAHAAEAAACQDAFWAMHDALFDDPGRLDDPFLWRRAEALGLDVERFEADRRSPAVAERVERDFVGAVRAGIVTTPTLIVAGRPHAGVPAPELLASLG